MKEISNIFQLLQVGSNAAPAIAAPEQEILTYQQLRQHVEMTVDFLNQCGLGRKDRVAIVLPNGPEMASAFVSIAAGATTAPLNPAYQQQEFHFYLSDLQAKALVVAEASTSPALDAAVSLKIPILRLKKTHTAGLFELQPDSATKRGVSSQKYAEREDIALVLHTSGTTSRPKLVPLSHQNVCASAKNIGQALNLNATDRCLNIMPLFHIHGLMAPLLASLYAGACVYCTPGFNALKFFSWMEQAQPSWYSAVPTMHQAILSRASKNQAILAGMNLRLIRSSSSSLPPQVMEALEQTFQAPVIESYGMTEAAHQMTSNPLPPQPRKPGSVGIAAGPEVAIMDPHGQIQPQGVLGEIVIRGANVTGGYENNPQANAENFSQGWFRTGDQGRLDAEGYLSISGRLKEIINRGGEKISPREVDEVLMDHAAVQQVVTFALPHEKLGEEVAAVVVLEEGKTATEQELRHFAGSHLAPFKVPRKIVFLDEIPKGATGKLQRLGLAQKLGLG